MKQMMSLGGFVFSFYQNTPYSGLTRSSDGGWVTVPRYGQKPISQNTGQALENINLTGEWYGGDAMTSMDELRALQNKRLPVLLVDGYGRNLGQWTIKKLEEKQGNIIDDATAMIVGFTVSLEEYSGDYNSQP